MFYLLVLSGFGYQSTTVHFVGWWIPLVFQTELPFELRRVGNEIFLPLKQCLDKKVLIAPAGEAMGWVLLADYTCTLLSTRSSATALWVITICIFLCYLFVRISNIHYFYSAEASLHGKANVSRHGCSRSKSWLCPVEILISDENELYMLFKRVKCHILLHRLNVKRYFISKEIGKEDH